MHILENELINRVSGAGTASNIIYTLFASSVVHLTLVSLAYNKGFDDGEECYARKMVEILSKMPQSTDI